MIDQNFFRLIDALDANGFKIPTDMVLELDASPKHQQMKDVCAV